MVIFADVILLSRLLANLPAGKLLIYTSAGAVVGGAVALPCMFIAYAAAGGSYSSSVTQVGGPGL